MASIKKEITVKAAPEQVWDAIRDFGAVHERVVPGFVTALRLDGEARIVTFSNGSVARELLVDADDEARRLVYAIVGGKLTAHSASIQVFAEGDAECRVVWTADLLPNELAGYVGAQMDEGAKVMREVLAGPAAAPSSA